ncbi:MAG: signal peptidase I [Elusimicrobia bacterium]|nr:signal peptidase I [Elusimicrobiota bacterium]
MAESEGVSLWRFLQLAVLAVCVFGALHLFVFESIVIPTASMEPKLPVGTHCFLDKVTYRLRAPARGDIIVFKAPAGAPEELVKRVIAVPGDTVELRDKKVVLNGVEQRERYVRHSRAEEKLVGDNLGPLEVPKGCYFVLGDNRDESNDSSVWKDSSGAPAPCVPADNVRGIVRGFF